MSNEENPSGRPKDVQANVQVVQQTVVSNEPQRQARPRSTRRRRSRFTPRIRLLITLISAITPIAVALLSFPPLIERLRPSPTLAPTFTLTSSNIVVAFSTSTPAILFTETVSPAPPPSTTTPSLTVTPSETVTLSPQPTQPILIVKLEANKTSGKAPLSVKLDARSSYMTDFEGRMHVCRNGPCFYTWKVYSNGQQIGKSVTGSGGTFDYKFTKKGIYTITVWVCRGRDSVDCGGSGIQVVVS